MSAARLARLSECLGAHGIDAYFACAPNSMGYLSGFFEYSYERLLILAVRSSGDVRLICPALSASQAERCGIRNIRPWADGEDPLSHIKALAEDWNLRSAMIAVDDMMAARHLLDLQGALPAALFQRGGPILAELRSAKDAAEIDAMRRAAQVADRAYEAVLPQVRPGLTELEIQDMLAAAMRERGGQPTFTIAAVGANSAEPHHLGDATVARPGEILLMDFGCSVDGYQSDITRCVCLGQASAKMKRIYEVVHRAFMAGRAALRPGVTGAEADAAARQVIAEAGYGDRFVHRLGHGIGLDGHEEPNLVSTNHDPLPVGACCSVEPGIYLPGEFGVRIENIVAITGDGHETLNDEPPGQIPELVVS